MKTIDSIQGLKDLVPDLVMFILGSSSPWIEEEWDPENSSFYFLCLLDEKDSHKVTSIDTVPHIPESGTNYRDLMTIDLATFDLVEAQAYCDAATGYWNVVAIFGQDYDCVLFMSSSFVESIPALHARLQDIKEHKYNN